MIVLFDGQSFNYTEICWWLCWIRLYWTPFTEQWFSFWYSYSSLSMIPVECPLNMSTSTTFRCWHQHVYNLSTHATLYHRYPYSSMWWWYQVWNISWLHWSTWNLYCWLSCHCLSLHGNCGRKSKEGVRRNTSDTNIIHNKDNWQHSRKNEISETDKILHSVVCWFMEGFCQCE